MTTLLSRRRFNATLAAILPGVALVSTAPAGAAPKPASYEVATEATKIVDPARSREIGIKFTFPKGYSGKASVILISHGGTGSERGEFALAQLAPTYARNGFLAINLGHRTSATQAAHRKDRPADVSFVLNALADDRLPLPSGFKGSVDLMRVGHAGHSWGAYTAHAVGGAVFDQGQFRDKRIVAIVPISPQGPDQFGSFDRGQQDNSWMSVTVPAFILTGGAEVNGPPGEFRMERWRTKAFERYPAIGDKFLAVVPDQTHAQMGGGGTAEVSAYEAENTAAFFDAYLRKNAARICEIGTLAFVPGTNLERKLGEGAPACPAPPAAR